MAVTPIYRRIMLEVEARRLALGLPMEKFSDWAGIAERSYPKYLHADTPSGRQASWEVLQVILNALYPGGFEIVIKPKPGAVISEHDMKAELLKLRARANPKTHRELMSEYARKAKFENRQRARMRLSKRQRKKIARMGGIERARRARELRNVGSLKPVEDGSA